jgi:hypothetical protein
MKHFSKKKSCLPGCLRKLPKVGDLQVKVPFKSVFRKPYNEEKKHRVPLVCPAEDYIPTAIALVNCASIFIHGIVTEMAFE